MMGVTIVSKEIEFTDRIVYETEFIRSEKIVILNSSDIAI